MTFGDESNSDSAVIITDSVVTSIQEKTEGLRRLRVKIDSYLHYVIAFAADQIS